MSAPLTQSQPRRLRIVTADERLSAAANKTTLAIVGESGTGKTTLARALPEARTLFLDLEAGMKSIQDWRGDSIPIRCFEDMVVMATLIGGPNPALPPAAFFSNEHHAHCVARHPELVATLAMKSIVFVDSITDLTRQAMVWTRKQPEAFSEKTGKPDIRGAYGLLGREVIGLLKHLQHAPGKTVILVGILEKHTDEFGRTSWQPQMEGGKAARELPGIVDQVITLGLFSRGADGALQHDPQRGTERRLVCRAGNRFGLPAKDRSGRLAETEPPDLAALLRKINATNTSQG